MFDGMNDGPEEHRAHLPWHMKAEVQLPCERPREKQEMFREEAEDTEDFDDCDAVKGLGARIADEVEVVWLTPVVQIASPVCLQSYSPLTLALRLLLTAQPFGVKCRN